MVNLAIMLISDGELLRSCGKWGFLSLGGLVGLSPAPILQVGVAAEVLITPAVPALALTVGCVFEVGLAGPSGGLRAPP